jgi:hypothetical protein
MDTWSRPRGGPHTVELYAETDQKDEMAKKVINTIEGHHMLHIFRVDRTRLSVYAKVKLIDFEP